MAFYTTKTIQTLLVACFNGEIDLVKEFLFKYKDIVNCYTYVPDGKTDILWSPLTAAAYNGQIEIVKLLLENGAEKYGCEGSKTISKNDCVEILKSHANDVGNPNILLCAEIIEEQGKETGSCYIATACYGSYNSHEVLIFRKFRDEILLKYYFGKKLVSAYYLFSPPIAKKLNKMKRLNSFVKKQILNRIIKIIKNNINK